MIKTIKTSTKCRRIDGIFAAGNNNLSMSTQPFNTRDQSGNEIEIFPLFSTLPGVKFDRKTLKIYVFIRVLSGPQGLIRLNNTQYIVKNHLKRRPIPLVYIYGESLEQNHSRQDFSFCKNSTLGYHNRM